MFAFVALLPVTALAAGGPVPLGDTGGKFGDWTAATYGSGAAKACYAFTTAINSAPALVGRGPPMLTVVERQAAHDEVTLSAGFAYPNDAKVTLAVNGSNLSFYTKGETAFTTDGAAAVIAFEQGANASASSSAPGGKTVTDNFSLAGFSDAYHAITAACP